MTAGAAAAGVPVPAMSQQGGSQQGLATGSSCRGSPALPLPHAPTQTAGRNQIVPVDATLGGSAAAASSAWQPSSSSVNLAQGIAGLNVPLGWSPQQRQQQQAWQQEPTETGVPGEQRLADWLQAGGCAGLDDVAEQPAGRLPSISGRAPVRHLQPLLPHCLVAEQAVRQAACQKLSDIRACIHPSSAIVELLCLEPRMIEAR
jgi:hypothetical protein